jgi:hypothetical protein
MPRSSGFGTAGANFRQSRLQLLDRLTHSMSVSAEG